MIRRDTVYDYTLYECLKKIYYLHIAFATFHVAYETNYKSQTFKSNTHVEIKDVFVRISRVSGRVGNY